MNKRVNLVLLEIALLLIAAPATLSHAQSQLPLSGPAYVLAEEANLAYARGDYRLALEKAQEARRLRPDVGQLRTLVNKAKAAQIARAPRAVKPAQNRPMPPVTQPGLAPTTGDQPLVPDLAFASADAGYRSFERREYAAAAEHARQALLLAPTRRDYWLLRVNSLIAENRLAEADQVIADGIEQAGDDGKLVALRATLRQRLANAQVFELANASYKAIDERNFTLAVSSIRKAAQLAPGNRDYQLLLVKALSGAAQYEEAEQVATTILAAGGTEDGNAALLAQRGAIRMQLGKNEGAREDFESALRTGHLPIGTEIGLLVDLDRETEARQRFDAAQAGGTLAYLPDLEVAYLAARVGDDEAALAAFNHADASGKLPNRAFQDAAFTAMRTNRDAEAITYFKRSLDDTGTLKLRMDPQLRFNTRRAIAEISRETGLIASLTYRGAVSGRGVVPGSAADAMQAGIEAYWRPFGYRNGRYVELFARAFETLYSKGEGATGAETVQGAVGVRYKPFVKANLVASASRVFSRSGRREDWLAQLAYSDAVGGDLRVDVPAWWTTRYSVEGGRYVLARQSYALSRVESGRSFRVGDGDGKWVMFPHLSIAADYDSGALEKNSMGAGLGIGARYWFREDFYHAPRSYYDMLLGYRVRLTGAERAEGVFLTTTLLY